jgi:DNA-binding transcriptional ArsR family regulator
MIADTDGRAATRLGRAVRATTDGAVVTSGRHREGHRAGTRLRIVLALTAGRLCVGDIASVVGISESGVSHQPRLLPDRRIVRPERMGQRTFYSVDDAHLARLVRSGHPPHG